MVAEVIGVGRDLLNSEDMETNVEFLASELAALGIDLNFQSTVGDNKLRLQKCAATALERSDIVILMGGIGGGEDDNTKEIIAEGIGSMLTLHQESLTKIKEYYHRHGGEMPLACVKEAMFPDGAQVFPNNVGTSPGCALTSGKQSIVMLPSDPTELALMVVGSVYRYLADVSNRTIVIRDLIISGLTPVEAGRKLSDLMQSDNPILALYPHNKDILARVTARSDTQRQSISLCMPMVKEISSRLGRNVQALGTGGQLVKSEVASSAAAEPPKRKWWQNIIPWKGDDGRDIASKSILLVSSIVLIGSLSYIGWEFYQSYANESLVSNMENMLGEDVSRPDGYPKDYLTKFVPWWELNPDVAGRIEIDGTPLKYAIVQSKDNLFYLRRNFYKKDDKHGVPFLDYRVDQKKESDNTLIYGHNMKDGQIFGELMNYKGLDYYKKHPVIRYDSVYREGEYKIISVFVTNIYERDGVVWPYHNFIDGTDAEFDNYVQQALARSLINTTVDVKPGDKLLTLSTCSYEFKDARTVVVARKVREGESAEVDTAKAKMNPNPVMPGGYWEALTPSSSAASSEATSLEEESSENESEEESSDSSSEASSESSNESSSEASSENSSSASSSKPSSSKPTKPSSSSEEESSEEESSEEEAPPPSRPSSSSEEEIPSSRPISPSSASPSAPESSAPPASGATGRYAKTDTVTVDGQSMEAYDAVCQMVMNETGGTFKAEAIKAQTVAVYSRLVARGGSVSGMGLRTPNNTVKNAVNAVWGETVQSGGRTVDAYFCSTSAGTTNTSREVWGGSLVGHNQNVDSHWDESSVYYGYETRMSKDAVIDKIDDKFSVDLSAVPEDEWFEVNSTTGGGYNDKMTIGGEKTTTGRYLRESVLGLKSACFEWSFTENDVVFTTYGYGHGVGMSQFGANEMAKEGSTYRQIIEHYYPGCSVGAST